MLHSPLTRLSLPNPRQDPRPVLLVCLRHLGCAFSREALADLRAQRAGIEAAGARLVIAHLEAPAAAAPVLARFGLGDADTISDPRAELYEACGLARGSLRQLAGPRVLRRWFAAAVLAGRGAGWSGADMRRMPGVFLVEQGRILRAFRHATTADRPDYLRLCRAD